jgi:hypothetical protein
MRSGCPRDFYFAASGAECDPCSPPGGGCVALAAAAVSFFAVRTERVLREVVGPCAVGQRATHRQGGCTRIHHERACVRRQRERERELSRNLGQLTRAFASALLCFCARHGGGKLDGGCGGVFGGCWVETTCFRGTFFFECAIIIAVDSRSLFLVGCAVKKIWKNCDEISCHNIE